MRESFYSVADELFDFYIDGLATLQAPRDALASLREFCVSVKFYEKYKGTEDAIFTSEDISRLWTSLEITRFVKEARYLSGRPSLVVGDLALRRVFPSDRPYLNWHRDTWSYEATKRNGRVPPLVKLIIYFKEDGSGIEPSLCVSRGSHRRIVHANRYIDLGINALLNRTVIGARPCKLEAILFASEICHKVIPPSNGCSTRLIVNFCEPHQFSSFQRNSDLSSFLSLVQEKYL